MEFSLLTFYLTLVVFIVSVILLFLYSLRLCVCKYNRHTETVKKIESDLQIDTELEKLNSGLHSPPPDAEIQ